MLYTGDRAGRPVRRPASASSSTTRRARSPATRCRQEPTRGGACCCAAPGDGVNDVLQYWFGAYHVVPGDGLDENGQHLRRARHRRPLHWSRRGASTAAECEQPGRHRCPIVATSGILPPDQFKQFESWPSARWDKPGGPFAPHTGDQYVYSQIADVTYKRLTRTITVPAGGATMSFWTSYDTEVDWDFLFVEAHTAGQDELDDAARTPTDTPAPRPATAAAEGWHDAASVAGPLPDVVDNPEAPTTPARPPARPVRGTRPAANSGGWQQWSVEPRRLRGPAGRGLHRVCERLGHARASASSSTTSSCRPARAARRSRPAWTAGRSLGRRRAAPPTRTTGSAPTPRASRWGLRSRRRGPIIMGFGVEGISTAAARNAVMGRAMGYLLP